MELNDQVKWAVKAVCDSCYTNRSFIFYDNKTYVLRCRYEDSSPRKLCISVPGALHSFNVYRSSKDLIDYDKNIEEIIKFVKGE